MKKVRSILWLMLLALTPAARAQFEYDIIALPPPPAPNPSPGSGWIPLPDAAVKAAWDKLVKGRAYKYNYPVGGRTYRDVTKDFLGEAAAPAGINSPEDSGYSHNARRLKEAISLAVAYRSANTGGPHQNTYARTVAWEAMEALTEGYLFAGNRDLIAALRKSYPTNLSVGEPVRGFPLHISGEVTGASGLKQIGFAELYFQEPVIEVLTYMAQDPTGRLRAKDVYNQFPSMPHYTRFDSSQVLLWPRRESPGTLDDPNFTQNPGSPSWTAASLLGEALDRWAIAANNHADKLWRAAYLGKPRELPSNALSPTAFDKDPRTRQLLGEAAKVLRNNVHAQFLSSLPLAATLDDQGGDTSEYAASRVVRTRANVTASQELLRVIASGEQPKEDPEVRDWSTAAIQSQISEVETRKNTATAKYDGSAGGDTQNNVTFNVNRLENAAQLLVNDQIAIREKYQNQIKAITGIDPFAAPPANLPNPEIPYERLRTRKGKEAFIAAVQAKFNTFLADPAASLGETSPSEMGLAALRVRQSNAATKVAIEELNKIPQLVRNEENRNKAINTRITRAGNEMAALESAVELTRMQTTETGTSTLGAFFAVKWDIGAVTRAALSFTKAIRQADEQTDINDINSESAVKNLLADMDTRIASIQAAHASTDIALAELRKVYAQGLQLVEDSVFFYDLTEDLWYYDPTLAFKKERAEEEYAEKVAEYQIESYRLARMLELAWCESYANPVKKTANNGAAAEALSSADTAFDPFVNAESVFSTANHIDVTTYVKALKTWENKLRLGSGIARGGAPGSLTTANSDGNRPISLRQDMLRLVDYKFENGSFIAATQAEINRNKAEFRALLIDAARRDPGNRAGDGTFQFKRLRIEFPFVFNQRRKKPGLGEQFIVSGTENNSYWNHRLTMFGVKIEGTGVFPSATDFVPDCSIEWFGTLERIGFFVDSFYTRSRVSTPFEAGGPFDDVDALGRVALFGRDIKVLVGEATYRNPGAVTGGNYYLTGDTSDPNQTPLEWPLFSNRVILTIPAKGEMRIENIDDIQFNLYFRHGIPSTGGLLWGSF